MALPKKESRRIRVGSTVYRWAVSPDDGYMWLIVEIDGIPSQRLEVNLPYLDVYPHPNGPCIGQLMSVTPGLVRRCILRGISAGWTPTRRRSPPFRLDVGDRDLILPELAHTPDTAPASRAGHTRR